MDMWLPAIITAALAYLLGCSNGAVLVSKYILKNDVRNHGSGNAGLTNFHRVFGGKLTFLVIFSDALKAVLAILFSVWIARQFGYTSELQLVITKYWAGVFCLLGHMFPCMFHFKGGKGILSGGTVALMIDWRVALVVWGGFIIFVLLTRYVSLGSVVAGASFPMVAWFVYQDMVVLLLSAILGGLVVFMHRANIVRLVQGKESKFSLSKKKI